MVRWVRWTAWYLARPGLYPEFVRSLRSHLRQAWVGTVQPDTRDEAEQWCRDRAVDTGEAVLKLTGFPMPCPLVERFPDEFGSASQAARRCPFPMGGGANMDLLYALSEHLKADRVVETGVALGWSSLAVLLSLATRPESLLISTDKPYVFQKSDDWVGCVVPSGLRSHWKVIHQADREALPKALRILPVLDMCHYDSDKSLSGRRWAYPLLFSALRPGGIFISDDVGDDIAFKEFSQGARPDPLVVGFDEERGRKYVGILVKSCQVGKSE